MCETQWIVHYALLSPSRSKEIEHTSDTLSQRWTFGAIALLSKHIQRQRLIGFLERFFKTVLYHFVFLEDSFLQSEVILSLWSTEYNPSGAVHGGIHVAHVGYATESLLFLNSASQEFHLVTS